MKNREQIYRAAVTVTLALASVSHHAIPYEDSILLRQKIFDR